MGREEVNQPAMKLPGFLDGEMGMLLLGGPGGEVPSMIDPPGQIIPQALPLRMIAPRRETTSVELELLCA